MNKPQKPSFSAISVLCGISKITKNREFNGTDWLIRDKSVHWFCTVLPKFCPNWVTISLAKDPFWRVWLRESGCFTQPWAFPPGNGPNRPMKNVNLMGMWPKAKCYSISYFLKYIESRLVWGFWWFCKSWQFMFGSTSPSLTLCGLLTVLWTKDIWPIQMVQ